jgi:phospholipid/cholesterol/gamma-HCH transport system ATP-binding protein
MIDHLSKRQFPLVMDEEGSRRRPIIKIEGLTKRFEENVVLDALDLEIFDGETIAILGGSGSGKSVLLSLLVGLLEPDAGRIIIDGQRTTAFSRSSQWRALRLKIGFLFQGSALYDSLTIEENIAFILEHQTKLAALEIRQRVREKLRLVELEGVEDKLPIELSGGMQKRVALARAIVFDPRIVFYDEPTTGLDPVRGKHISELILRLQHELQATSVVVTHDLICASLVADRIAMLQGGKFIFIGSRDELQQSGIPYVREFLDAATHRCCKERGTVP